MLISYNFDNHLHKEILTDHPDFFFYHFLSVHKFFVQMVYHSKTKLKNGHKDNAIKTSYSSKLVSFLVILKEVVTFIKYRCSKTELKHRKSLQILMV